MKSKKITQSAKGEDCTLRVSPNCQDGETVVACHLNSPFKGVGFKSPDLFVVCGCYHCHIDHEDQLRALFETQMKLYKKGLINVV